MVTTSAPVSISVLTPPVGPVAAGRWPLDSVASGLTSDLSGNNNAGIVTGSYTFTAGTIGQAIQLDPGAGGVTTQRQVINSTQSYTVAVWVKLANTNGTQTFVSLPATSVSTFYLQLAGWLHRGFAMDVYPSDSTAAVDAVAASSTIPVANRWYHVAGVYDASAKQVRIYVNGVLDGQASAPAGSFANNGPLSFGFAKWNGNRADGTDAALDDVRVYDKALTAAEVLGVYNER